MKTHWAVSIIDGRYYNDKVQHLTIQELHSPVEYAVVLGVTTLFIAKTLYIAKVWANNYIRGGK